MWRSQEVFVYNDPSAECLDCDYRAETRDGKGNIYLGQWRDQMKEGRGAMIFATGDVYEGYWKNGTYGGKGRMIWAKNRMYDGQWKDGKSYGKGTSIY